eukprot:11540582-Alexandrium_andersonii.AAC.1
MPVRQRDARTDPWQTVASLTFARCKCTAINLTNAGPQAAQLKPPLVASSLAGWQPTTLQRCKRPQVASEKQWHGG